MGKCSKKQLFFEQFRLAVDDTEQTRGEQTPRDSSCSVICLLLTHIIELYNVVSAGAKDQKRTLSLGRDRGAMCVDLRAKWRETATAGRSVGPTDAGNEFLPFARITKRFQSRRDRSALRKASTDCWKYTRRTIAVRAALGVNDNLTLACVKFDLLSADIRWSLMLQAGSAALSRQPTFESRSARATDCLGKSVFIIVTATYDVDPRNFGQIRWSLMSLCGSALLLTNFLHLPPTKFKSSVRRSLTNAHDKCVLCKSAIDAGISWTVMP